MPEMILYLLKVNIALLLFYTGYHFILQRYTFHTLNRFYLLVGLIYSALYPLMNISDLLNRNQELKQQISVFAPDWEGSVTYVMNQAEDQAGNYWQVVLIIFWLGVSFMSLRLCVQLISLLILHLQSSTFTLGKFKFRKISKAVNPFSFWRTIYLNPECHEASELRSILEHEQVHVKQLHTFDVLLAELSTIFYWFNPGVWLMKKAIKANLEFITDHKVIQSGIDSKEYQYALLKSHILPQNSLPVNNFHFLTIKKRIAMINKRPSNRINIGGYFLILPAIMLLALIVSTSKAALNNKSVSEVVRRLPYFPLPAKIQNDPISLIAPASHSVNQKTRESLSGQSDTNKVKISGYRDMPIRTLIKVLENGTGASNLSKDTISVTKVIIRSEGVNSEDPESPQLMYFINGKPSASGVKDIKPEDILNITVSKTPGTAIAFGPQAINGVVAIVTKDQNDNSDFTDYYQKKDEALKYDAIIKSKQRINGINRNSVDNEKRMQTDKVIPVNITNRLFILDGKEASKSEIESLKAISIETMNVIKGAEAVIQYGERARDGVIVIYTKKQ